MFFYGPFRKLTSKKKKTVVMLDRNLYHERLEESREKTKGEYQNVL